MFKLMDKPNDENLKYKEKSLFYGKDLEDYVTNSTYNEWCRFYFPSGVKNKIEKEKMYKVWFDYRDASDPEDSSCSYHIHYIEEVPVNIKSSYEIYEKNEKIIHEYLKQE